MTIAAILKQKGSAIRHVGPHTRGVEIAAEMARHKIGALLVLDDAGRLLGVVSERDIVAAVARAGSEALAMTADALMTREVTLVQPSTSVEQAMEMMTHGRFRHLPVVENGALTGIVSIGDVVKRMIEDKSVEVDSLKAYVAGAA